MKLYVIPAGSRHSLIYNGVEVKEPLVIEVEDGEYRFEILSFFGTYNQAFYPSHHGRIIIKDGEISQVSDCFNLIKWNSQVFEVLLEPYCIDLNRGNFEFFEHNGMDIALENLHGGKKHICIYKNQNKIYQTMADDIQLNNDTLKVERYFIDMLMRRRIETYSLTSNNFFQQDNSQFLPQKVEFQYMEQPPNYNPLLVPYLFLEALGSADYQKAKEYLSADLGQNIAALIDYFGSFYSIDYPKYSNHTFIALKYWGQKYSTVKYFSFELTDSIITNIDETTI